MGRVAEPQMVDDFGLWKLFAHDSQHGFPTVFAGDISPHEDASVDALDANAQFIGPCVIRDGLLDALIGVSVRHELATLTGIS
jgi:hypothetical protein